MDALPHSRAVRRAWASVVLLGAMLVAGCTSPGQDGEPEPSSLSPSPTPAPPGRDCDAELGGLPVPPTWAAHGGAWSTVALADALPPHGLRGAGTDDPGLSLLIDHSAGPFTTVEATVEVLLVRGGHPDGAGLAFHWDGPSYNLVRYSPSEAGWHVFTVVEGNRTKLDAAYAPTPPPLPGWCAWTQLRVVARGAEVQVFQDGEAVLEATLPPAASASGQAGLFVRGDGVALFRGYAASGS